MFNFSKRYWILLSLVTLLFIGGAAVNWVSTDYINDKVPYRAVNPDLILDNIEFKDLSAINEVLLIASLLVLVFFAIKNKEHIPYYIFIFAVFQIIRGVFIVFTPLASSYPLEDFGLLHGFLPQGGMFPSGHVSTPFIAALFAWYSKNYLYYTIFILLFVGITLTMFWSKGHYTIDIIGALFISYGIFHFSNFHIKKYFTKGVIKNSTI